jgi:hypothetical protein
MKPRLARLLLVATIVASLSSVGFATPAFAEAVVLHPGDVPGCAFEPGDVPGVDVFFPAQCTIVLAPSGTAVLVALGQLPAGFSLTETFVGETVCTFGGVVTTAHIVATTSGQVKATCVVPPNLLTGSG